VLNTKPETSRAVRRTIVARRIWRTVHLWLGLSAGLILAIIGLTGALLVFNEQMSRAETGAALFTPIEKGEWRPVSEWIANVEKRYPEYAPVESVHGIGAVPIATGVPVLFKHAERGGKESHVLLGVNPVTAEPTGVVIAEDTWIGTILLLHVELLSGETGNLIVALVAVTAIVLTLTGLYLWWPRPGRWGHIFMVRKDARGAAQLLDLHNVPTVWLFVPYLIILLTGLYLQKSDWIDPLIKPLSEIRELQDSETASAAIGACAKATTIDGAIAIARKDRDPREAIKTIWLPSGPQTPYFIELSANSADPRKGGTVIWVDRNCPQIVSQREASAMTAGETIKAWLWPLHADLGLGLFGQILVAAVGLLLAGLFATGTLLWLKRR
jgi:uncharacterized iron-regulated membrane protein